MYTKNHILKQLDFMSRLLFHTTFFISHVKHS